MFLILNPRNDLKECKEPSKSGLDDKTLFEQAFAMMSKFFCFRNNSDFLRKAKQDAIRASKQAPGSDFGFHVPESSLNDWGQMVILIRFKLESFTKKHDDPRNPRS